MEALGPQSSSWVPKHSLRQVFKVPQIQQRPYPEHVEWGVLKGKQQYYLTKGCRLCDLVFCLW